MWATRKNGTIDSFNLFYVNRKWKGLATLHTQLYRRLHGRQTRIFRFSSTVRGGKLEIAALPPLPSAVNLTFQFSSAQRGGKLAIAALPPLPSAVKSIFQFSSAPRGGKLETALMLRVNVSEIFQSDFLSFFPFFCLLAVHGSGLSSTK